MKTKVMYAWMGVSNLTGQQMCGNTVMTWPAGARYRTESAMNRVASKIQQANALSFPAAIMGCIELDEEQS